MSLFVEVTSVDKNCSVIINLDHIVEIAPLAAGGCALFMSDAGGVNAKTSIKVKENYTVFKQFAMQTVTSEDIQKRIDAITPKRPKETPPVNDELEIPTLGKPKK